MKWAIASLLLCVLPSVAMADHRDYYGGDRFGASLRFNWDRGYGGYDRYDHHYSDYEYRPGYRDYGYDRCEPAPLRKAYRDHHPYYDTYRGRAYERDYQRRW